MPRMALQPFHVDPDIRRASTLPAEVYRDPAWYDLSRDRIFRRSWQLVGDTDRLKGPGSVAPLTLLEGLVDEPVLLTRDEKDRLHCMSNVCTHRGNLLVEGDGHEQVLRCRYHGRRFGLDGKFLSMPGFEDVEGFPTPADDLPRVPSGAWDKFLFASADPAYPLDELIGEMRSRVGWLPLREFTFDGALSRDYLVRANWILYIDNYLEGFHIPYVHTSLAATLDWGAYRTETYRYSSLQLGVASGGEDCFAVPVTSPDHGQRIAAYYYWLFPNTMFNFYPWGLSVNVIHPLGPDRTKVRFLSYVWDRAKLGSGAGGAIDRVEREDEDIVEKVQKGIQSSFYTRGRYSARHEQGIHHFHRLLSEFLRQ